MITLNTTSDIIVCAIFCNTDSQSGFGILFKTFTATQYIINEEGDPSVWLIEEASYVTNLKLLSNKYKKYLKVLTDCGQTGTSCVFPQYTAADKVSVYGGFVNSGVARYSLILQDGSAIVFHYDTSNANPNNRNKKKYATIYYDANGVKPPNRFGYDMFQFDLTEDGIYAYSETEFRQKVYHHGYYDSYWIITHKNLDFQRCPLELQRGAAGCKMKKK